jgi:hypothetical protein
MHRFRGWCNIPYEGTKATMYMDEQNHPNQHHASHFADHDLFKVTYKIAEVYTFDRYFPFVTEHMRKKRNV